MTPFDLAEPTSLEDAIALLDPDDSSVRPIAGGTALMLMMKAGVFRPTRIVSLRKLPARRIRALASRKRAAASGRADHRRHDPLSKVERSAEVARFAPVDHADHAAALQRPGPQRRNRRRQSRAWRSAHGPAARADRAWRASGGHRPERSSAGLQSRTCSPAISRPFCGKTS